MKMMVKFLTTTSMAVCFLSSAFAIADDKAPGSGPNPYVDCGIGAALFPKTHWAAVTSNVIWDIGITAITSATASPQTCSGKSLEAALFINETYDNIVEETARGEGSHLTSLLNILECKGSQHANAIQAARSAMGEHVSRTGYNTLGHQAKAEDLYFIMESSASRHCSA